MGRLRLAQLRDAFWLVPMLLGIAGIALAQILVAVDRKVGSAGSGGEGALLYQVGVSGGRDILGAIGGSMLAVAATSFSITISVLATASSTYGPRLVRNFMNDRGNQFVLGMFGATFLYSLMVLRAIRGGSEVGEEFVPDIAINVAVLLAIIDVIVLVYFINHIARSIQVSTLSARVRSELDAVVRTQYPESEPEESCPAPAPDGGSAVDSRTSGFVIGIDEDGLLDEAEKSDCLIVLRVRPGDHVIDGDRLATLHGTDDRQSVSADVCRHVHLGETRTPYQDIQFAVQQLTEMAVRALSPGTNDPYTAHNALNELAASLVPLARRRAPQLGRRGDDGTLRLVVTRLPLTELIDDVFGAVRTYAIGHPIAMTAAILLARRLGVAAVEPDVRAAVLSHLELIHDALDRVDDQVDAQFCRGEIDEARTAIAAA
ncbi:DUF2254 domain-containing protein [Gordonia sp. VNK1]|uniref:DUF2254 domain-containing protein n=1 Tax=Gordonia oleivorans TaxID=3156618 RepID=UPI0032B56387